jgi:hypothetical protein
MKQHNEKCNRTNVTVEYSDTDCLLVTLEFYSIFMWVDKIMSVYLLHT